MQLPAPEPPEAVPNGVPESPPEPAQAIPRELGRPAGPEPTRYGDWEKAGRCIDF